MLTKGLLLAIDANSLLHRAYHAYPLTLTTTDGQPVNAVYGFTSMLLDAILTYKPEYVFCAFDTKKATFRHVAYAGYKANRPQTDNELLTQIPYVYEVLKSLNIPVFAVEGYEADDLLGTVCQQLTTLHYSPIKQTYVLTGDRDLFQLVNERVQVVLPKGSFRNLEQFTEEKVLASMGVAPVHVPDLKGLMGDASDNIPGVKGIGPKSAIDLLTKFHTIEEIYTHIADIERDSKRVAQLLVDGEESARMSKELATILRTAPIQFKPDDAETKSFDPGVVQQLFAKLQFRSLFPRLNRLMSITGTEIVPEAVKEEKSNVLQGTLSEDFAKIGDVKIGTIETFSVAGKTLQERIDVLQSFTAKGQYLLIYCNESIKLALVEGLSTHNALTTFGVYEYFANAPDKGQLTISSTDLQSLFAKIIDIELLSFTTHTGRDDYSLQEDLLLYGMGNLSDALIDKASEIFKIAAIRIHREFERVAQYQSLSRIDTLWELLQNKNVPLGLTQNIDLPAIFGVALMHLRGISIDLETVNKEIAAFKEKLSLVERNIYDLVGFEFNIRSTRQLANVLFGNLALPNAKKTKTGFSTDDEVLQGLVDTHPVIKEILEFRQLSKLISTYMEPYLVLASASGIKKDKVIADATSQMNLFGGAPEVSEKLQNANVEGNILRVHSTFAVMGTTTGRLSSSNPNLQNLPVKTDAGKVIRRFFVPEKGYKLVSLDYSQIDLRVLAHISEDPGLIEAFKQGQDIHRSTAAKVFHVPFAEVTDQQRRFAKSINFGLMYGMSSYGLSKSIGVEVSEAAKFITEYFAQFPLVKKYMAETIAMAKEKGYVLSLLGRRRFVSGITANNKMRVQAAEREAINMPIQGGADDIMRLAMGRISLLPEVLSGEVRLVLQIHDELVFEMKDDSTFIEGEVAKIKDIMESVLKLSIPLKVDSAIGETLDL